MSRKKGGMKPKLTLFVGVMEFIGAFLVTPDRLVT